MTSAVDLAGIDAVELAGLIATGELTAVEAVTACLEGIDQAEPGLGGFVHVDADGALERARQVRAGPLAGVPFAVKDAVPYPGMRWAMGSRLLAGNVAVDHSPYTGALDAAGLVTVGKTATSELSLLGSTETLLEGLTRNPWGQDRSAAGSSGGAAAAVAAGLLPVAHAADGGGSIRVPASVSGLFGFKPSNGRMRPTMPAPDGLAALVVDHVVSRTVRDSALLLSVTERADADASRPQVGYVRHADERRLRIAAWRPTLTGRLPDLEVDAALTATLRLCADLGHDVEEIEAPSVDGDAVSRAFFTFAGQAVDQLASSVVPMLGRDPGPDELEPFTLDLLAWFRELRPTAVESAWTDLRQAAATYETLFDEADVALTPTLATAPWPLGYLAPTLPRAELVERTETTVGYTPIHNMAGCPAMSVPLAWSSRGLPIGMHLAAAPGEDALLLALAYELEDARPWRHLRPAHQASLETSGAG
jgi:amidase